MPRKVNKHKKKGKGGGGGNEDFKQREVLQAILLADSFTTTFRPVTRECPKVLLPLVNVPMIEYTLEFLAANNVEEVFVFCCAKAEQVQEYLAASKWNVAPLDDSDADDDLDPADDGVADASVSGPTVRILTAHSVTSAGDALREIDNLGVIRSNSPFVLVSGDVISNMDLKVCAVCAVHMRRCGGEPVWSWLCYSPSVVVAYPTHRVPSSNTKRAVRRTPPR